MDDDAQALEEALVRTRRYEAKRERLRSVIRESDQEAKWWLFGAFCAFWVVQAITGPGVLGIAAAVAVGYAGHKRNTTPPVQEARRELGRLEAGRLHEDAMAHLEGRPVVLPADEARRYRQ